MNLTEGEPDRRVASRRSDDREINWRLSELERRIDANTTAVAALQEALGKSFTNLMFQLDTRYMPRSELSTVYMSKSELAAHQQTLREEKYKSLGLKLTVPPLIFATLSWVITIIELFRHAHGR